MFPYWVHQNTPVNKSHATKIEEYLNEQYDHAAFVHLKNHNIKQFSKEREIYGGEIKCNSAGEYEVISSLRSQIEHLQSEVYFLREN